MKLTDIKSSKHTATGVSLANLKSRKFKIAFGTELENNFCFKTNKGNKLTEGMHKFLTNTVYKNLTITEVDSLYLRTKGKVKEKRSFDLNDSSNQLDILHYGFKRDTFRLFGYYDENGYFNVIRIDIDHKTHP